MMSKLACALAFAAVATSAARIPVNVLLQLDVVTPNREVHDEGGLRNQLQQLKNAGVSGVSIDVWWGLVERDGPKQYHWDPYYKVVQMCKEVGLKISPIMSFHRCGGNVGDACDIPVPSWVGSQAGDADVYYKDREGYSTQEYLSLGVDNLSVFGGRTGINLYEDFMASFNESVVSHFPDVVDEVHVSMGPAGELRYPSYPLQKWSFCGVGEFTCYDKNMLNMLADAATASGHPEWGHGGPDNAGSYNSKPWDAQFFANSYNSDYGRFFLNWYSTELLNHGIRVITAARKQFPASVKIAGKIAGIHWWYNSPHHGAELTAGYYNTNGQDFYDRAAKALKEAGADILVFTCMEMKDDQQPGECQAGPFELVRQVKTAAGNHGIAFSGENALPRFDDYAYQTIEQQASWKFPSYSFTYLRLGGDLLRGDNFGKFRNFVQSMDHLEQS